MPIRCSTPFTDQRPAPPPKEPAWPNITASRRSTSDRTWSDAPHAEGTPSRRLSGSERGPASASRRGERCVTGSRPRTDRARREATSRDGTGRNDAAASVSAAMPRARCAHALADSSRAHASRCRTDTSKKCSAGAGSPPATRAINASSSAPAASAASRAVSSARAASVSVNRALSSAVVGPCLLRAARIARSRASKARVCWAWRGFCMIGYPRTFPARNPRAGFRRLPGP